MPASKINVKDRFTDGEVDLSMSDISEVPVKEIAALKKTYSVDLSNNRIISLPVSFPTLLSQLTKLDLSKNELTELPENFGELTKLCHLDLYRNKLERLPLSFQNLTKLKFLDLKDNPLVPAVSKAAGPCLDTKQCQQCARDVVAFFGQLQKQVDEQVHQQEEQKQKEKEVKKKKEDKKQRKKERQRGDAQKTDDSEELVVEATEVAPKKTHKTVERKRGRKLSGFLMVFVLTLVTLLLLLFFVSALGFKEIEFVERHVATAFGKVVSTVPKGYQGYLTTFGEHFYDLHRATGIKGRDLLEGLESGKFGDIAKTIILKIKNMFH